jgi:predicted heme/steroid binding protein
MQWLSSAGMSLEPTRGPGAESELPDFTPDQLSRFDGSRGPAYVAYAGRVYDVSDSPEWRHGLHRQLHWAGQDLTRYLADAPHGEENLARYPVVGRLRP